MLYVEPAVYPNFKKIHFSDIPAISSFTKQFPSYSDFNAASLFCWNANEDNSFSFLNNNLVIKIKDYLSNGYIYSLLGNTDVDKNLQELISNGITELHMVPELTISSMSRSNIFDISEERDSFDYILDIQNFRELCNKSLRKKITKFKTENPKLQTRIMDLTAKNDINYIMDLNSKWCQLKGFSKDKMKEDTASINKFISIANQIKTFAVGVFIYNNLVAFSLNEIINDTWAMGHFGKSLNNIKYSSLFSEYITENELLNNGVKFINIQQDTGLSGLRETKMSYHPAYFLKKYSVIAKVH